MTRNTEGIDALERLAVSAMAYIGTTRSLLVKGNFPIRSDKVQSESPWFFKGTCKSMCRMSVSRSLETGHMCNVLGQL